MKKLMIIALLVFIATSSMAAPPPPQLCFSATGLSLSISWTPVSGATGYTLYYAPYPYTGPDSIGHFDMGNATNASYYLWENANYYITVTAKDGSGESAYSNIELLQLTSSATSGSLTNCQNNSNDIQITGGAWLEYRGDTGGPLAGTLDSCYEFYPGGTVYWHYINTEGTPYEGTVQWQLNDRVLTLSTGTNVTFTDTSDPNRYKTYMVWDDQSTATREWVRTDSCDPWRGQ